MEIWKGEYANLHYPLTSCSDVEVLKVIRSSPSKNLEPSNLAQLSF